MNGIKDCLSSNCNIRHIMFGENDFAHRHDEEAPTESESGVHIWDWDAIV
jgi:hypothetical protein